MHAHYIQQALVKVEQKLENERTRNQVGILESIFTFFAYRRRQVRCNRLLPRLIKVITCIIQLNVCILDVANHIKN